MKKLRAIWLLLTHEDYFVAVETETELISTGYFRSDSDLDIIAEITQHLNDPLPDNETIMNGVKTISQNWRNN